MTNVSCKYWTPVQMTHCVSANDARVLTQMDTNTAGTPNIIKNTFKKYCDDLLVSTIIM